MDLLNMTNRAQIHEFYKKKVNRENFIFKLHFEFWLFLLLQKFVTEAKFQFNMSKIMPVRPKNTKTHGM